MDEKKKQGYWFRMWNRKKLKSVFQFGVLKYKILGGIKWEYTDSIESIEQVKRVEIILYSASKREVVKRDFKRIEKFRNIKEGRKKMQKENYILHLMDIIMM